MRCTTRQSTLVPPRKSRPATLSVLVADDNVAWTACLSQLICRWGHECRVAADGPGALTAAAECPADVALLDIDLPGMDGCEVARRLRQLPGLGGIVLVAVTGYADEEHRRRCDGAGFGFYVVKPAIPGELEALLGALARLKGDPAAG